MYLGGTKKAHRLTTCANQRIPKQESNDAPMPKYPNNTIRPTLTMRELGE